MSGLSQTELEKQRQVGQHLCLWTSPLGFGARPVDLLSCLYSAQRATAGAVDSAADAAQHPFGRRRRLRQLLEQWDPQAAGVLSLVALHLSSWVEARPPLLGPR